MADPDWETTHGDGKVVSGRAAQTVDGVTSALDDMTGWTDPEVLIKPAGSLVEVFSCDLDEETATFQIVLDELATYPRVGDHKVKFRATDPGGKIHTFPEDSWKTLKIYRGDSG